MVKPDWLAGEQGNRGAGGKDFCVIMVCHHLLELKPGVVGRYKKLALDK